MSGSTASRSIELVLLAGAVLAFGAMAVSLLPSVPGGLAVRVGIVTLLATPWVATLVIAAQALATGNRRRALFAVALLLLAGASLLP
jgi:hypothetical protein